jgi:hypothetical protein
MDLRKFRHSVSVLKKQGLLPARASSGLPLDARSVTPKWKINGKSLGSIVNKYDDVTSGKATAIVVPPAKLKALRKAGYETTGDRVIVPHSATEKAGFIKGEVTIKNKSGIQRVQIPVEYHNLNQYLADIKKNSREIDRMKADNEYFGVRFYGGQRANFYADIESLMDDLSRYEDLQKRNSRAKQSEIYQNLEIIKITPAAALRIESQLETRKKAMSKAYNREHRKRYWKSLKRKPSTLRKIRNQDAARKRAYRASLTGKPLEDYKKKANKRAKKSYKKRNKKK